MLIVIKLVVCVFSPQPRDEELHPFASTCPNNNKHSRNIKLHQVVKIVDQSSFSVLLWLRLAVAIVVVAMHRYASVGELSMHCTQIITGLGGKHTQTSEAR